MNAIPPPPDPLLRALLDETAPEDFRAATLAATLRGARRRRVIRRARAVSAALALPLLAAALLLFPARRVASDPALVTHQAVTPTPHTPALAACETIRTRPAPELLVVTAPLAAGQRLASAPLERAARVRTDARLGPLLIDDAELLALAPPASALVRLAPGRQRLIFVDSP